VLTEVIADLKNEGGKHLDAVNLETEHKRIANHQNKLFRERFLSDCFGRKTV
jgi:hypothetical protein